MPSLTDGVCARLADVDPTGDVHLVELELEERMVVDRLDHPANTAALDDVAHELPHVVVRCLACSRTDAQLVIVRAGKGVDHAPRVAAQVPTLRRRRRDGGEQTAVRDDRTEGVEARSTVAAYRRQVADREDRLLAKRFAAARGRRCQARAEQQTPRAPAPPVRTATNLPRPDLAQGPRIGCYPANSLTLTVESATSGTDVS